MDPFYGKKEGKQDSNEGNHLQHENRLKAQDLGSRVQINNTVLCKDDACRQITYKKKEQDKEQ
jgi:hypothetical protein